MVNFHPQHLGLHQEIHARPYPEINAPCIVSHIVFFHDKKEIKKEYRCINQLAKIYHVNGIAEGINSYFQAFENFSMRWENHREFSSISIIRSVKDPLPVNATALEMFPEGWLEAFPGEVISATHFSISSQLNEQTVESHLGRRPSIASHLINKQFTVWSNLHLDAQGFTRFFICQNSQHEKGVGQKQLGRVVLKMAEIETYRQMALLGLPIAKSIAPIATILGQQCASMLEKMTQVNSSYDESQLLQELTRQAAEVEKLRASSSYRFSATQAYAELVNSRVEELEEERVEHKDMLGEFMQRRFMPAVRTCHSVQLQLESLSRRLIRASDLLRTRVDQTIAGQNQKLLESMNRRSHMQLRLQQTVEGLSVAAISYYLISLLKIFLHGISEQLFQFNENLILVIATPLVLLSLYLVVRNMKKHYIDSE